MDKQQIEAVLKREAHAQRIERQRRLIAARNDFNSFVSRARAVLDDHTVTVAQTYEEVEHSMQQIENAMSFLQAALDAGRKIVK